MNLIVPLHALLEERSVTRAAKRVNLSQPAMSHALDRLRDTFSDDLLIRDGHRDYLLTARGKQLLQELEWMLPRLERFLTGQAFSPRDATGRIRVVMTDYATAVILPRIVGPASLAAPGVQIHVSAWQEYSYADLLAGRVDLVFSALAPPHPIYTEVLFQEHFVCLVAENHPYKGRAFSLSQYLQYRHVMIEMDPNQQTLVDRPLAEIGKRREIGLIVPYFLAGVMALRDTELILTVPSRVAPQFLGRYPFRQVKAPAEIPRFQYLMAWHPRLENEDLYQWFRDVLRKHFHDGMPVAPKRTAAPSSAHSFRKRRRRS
ncbi:LysR family transcriptional regulator [Silvibacterium dinghuense]|uniref:LysR family transcriptional regulator n=1 Tax=Silvibacterium dinghuense TaxID=1560006 RepID=UPI001666D504|nr:LysR family transcriptional regulator [Silvibacterium dinghuense]